MGGLSIREKRSPNVGPRHGVSGPDLVILHYTNMPSAEAALDRLCDPSAQVSAHYLIEPGGGVWRLAPEEERAWHAGVSFWNDFSDSRPKDDINSRSIGVELAHPGHETHCACAPFPEAQMAALEGLLAGILARWAIPPQNVLAHSDVAPGRKIDPGEKFDWDRLARGGLAIARPAPSLEGSDAAGDLKQAFRAALMRIGYGDWPQDALEDAFKRRWSPKAIGQSLTSEDVQLAEAVAKRFENVRG